MKPYYVDDNIDEKFTSKTNRDAHWTKHIKRNKEYKMTPEEYEAEAEKLANTPIDNKNIFGYVELTTEGKTAYCKYNKDKELFTVYYYKHGVPLTITAFHKSWREYTGDKSISYFDEIPKGK